MARVFLFIFPFSLLTFSTAVIASIGKTDSPQTSALLPYIANVTHREQQIDRKGMKGYRHIFIFACFQICCLKFGISF